MDRELVVSPLIDALLGKLNLLSDAAAGGGNDWALMECDLTKLRFTINQIAEVVVVAEHKLFFKEIANGEWLEEVEEAAYDAADLLDLMIANNNFCKTLLSGSLIRSPVSNLLAKEVVNCISFPRRLDELVLKLGKVKKLALRFFELWKEGKDIVPYDSREAGLLIRSHIRSRPKLNLQGVEEIKASLQSDAILGRYEDKNRMLDLLIDNNSQLRPRVIPIVGQDGVGKTTLAQMIYNDEVVKARFNLRAWVSVDAEGNVPDDSIAEKIGKGIVESAMGMSCQLVAVDELDELVRDALESKTCLIVLAGVNSMMSREAWMRLLEKWFSTVAPGSSVIVTTCNSEVADFMSTVRPYQLNALSEEDSWSLFRQLAFEPFQVMESPEIVSIARKIVVRCLGIPLFLNLLGGLMRFHKTKEEWLSVHDCFEMLSARPWMACCITPLHSDIHNFLSVCYHYLPPHLKQCFAYCSIFSKDRVLDKDKVIQMWIAEGLVQSTGGNGTLEEIGNVFFQELLCRSFFTGEKWDEYGETTGYRMHPLLHDLARFVANFDHVVKAGVGCSQSRKFCQVSLAFHSKSSTISKSLDLPKHLRTLLLLSGGFQGTVDPSVRLKSLRVLDLSFSGIQKLSSHIAISQHLRYLDLSQTSIKRLPNSLTNLKHLQTLRLSRCSHLQELPEGMHNMTDLRHLDVSFCHSLSHMPSRLGQLTSLQSLPLFVLGESKGSAHLGDLHKLNLRGKLEIKNLENVTHISEARDARLYEKENLYHLGLSWNHVVDASSKISSDLLLESLWPHPKLKVLDITGYNSIRFPSWMMDSTIHNLVKVLITHCKCEELPPLGQLPYLKELCIRWMTNLRSIGPEFYGDNSGTPFPSLHQIELSNMPVLVEWLNLASLKESTSATIGYTFPCLNTMIVEDCPELIGFPVLSALKNLVIRNSNKKLLCSLANLRSLSSLVINGIQVELPGDLGNSNSIEKLMIRRCVFLDYHFEECMQGFTSVKHLGILYCNEMAFFPIRLRYLTSLQKLDIIECHDLKFMLDVRESLPLLQELSIEGCSLLASLPNDMYNLPSLQKLIIKGCLELSYLPETLCDISALRYLLISGCPKLEKRLERATGEDWFKIAHVPCIIIS
ncbi:putative disease resistance protein RGA3 [Camellia sinensis]|uniref:putative disease resistance protein RGA3 n=1 Tax=Camellia sinensis TaxID=4442 RepID=UPI00103650F3|nr:putative disease resistance protein RGA3 [Camellia sinensis]XP_028110384.1 putative disease resistance protein RGA3 [Camellia sinensis]XP_028110385.1 putative disease resistance protein RGA3 [Camellia sinensis]